MGGGKGCLVGIAEAANVFADVIPVALDDVFYTRGVRVRIRFE
jgi:hypothetical protein